MTQNEQIAALYQKAVECNACTPLERCWALRNYIGTSTGRYDSANEIAAMICDIIIPNKPNYKMVDNTDDGCVEYWQKTKSYLLGGR